MKSALFKLIGFITLLLLLMSDAAHSAAASLSNAQKEAESKGRTFISSHDEIVANARKEGKLWVSSRLGPSVSEPLVNAFKQKYPFITDIRVQEIAGTAAFERFLLEIQAGQAKGWDITHVPIDSISDYIPHLKRYDIFGMASNGVVKIDPRMIHPGERNILSITTGFRVAAYNKKLLPEDRVPGKWEDFLKPEFKGRKFLMDVRPLGVASLVPAWGLKKTLDFARKLAAQQPVWSNMGGDGRNTLIATGEFSLDPEGNFHSVKRNMSKDRTGNLSYKIIEPVPTRVVDHLDGVLNTANSPHAALLWLEFLASSEGQQIIDKYFPLRASLYTPGSAAEQELRGKELSVVDWNHFSKFEQYVAKIVEAYGFPKSEK